MESTHPTPQESVTIAAGLRLHYMEAGHGPLVVLIHGSLCDYRYWRWQTPDFSKTLRVVAPSLPGCWPEAVGVSTATGEQPGNPRDAALSDRRYSMEQHVQAMVDFCQQQPADTPIYLVGHSRGAQVALETALALPGRIQRLVLADPGFPFSHEPGSVPVHVAVAQRMGLADMDDVIAEFVDAVNGANTWRRTVSWFKDMVRANAWTLLPQVNDIDRGIDLAELQNSLLCPVLLVEGELSPARYGDRITHLKQALPTTQHVVVPKAAHGMNLANAPYFNNAVLKFLTD